jgi:hypothetical protein
MPFVSDPNLDDPNNPTGSQQPGQVSGQPNLVSGSTGTQNGLQSANSATESPQAPSLAGGQSSPSAGAGKSGFDAKAPTSSGQWTNLQNYLNANNGAQFGTQFSGNIEKNVDQASGDLNNATNEFQQNVQASANQLDPRIIDELNTNPTSMSSEDQASFQKAFRGGYQGPQNSASDVSFQKATSEAQNAYDESAAAKTAEGKFALLQKYFNNPNYTRGQQSLDSAILSNDPGAEAEIERVANKASDLPVQVQSEKRKADAASAAAQARNNKSMQDALNALYGSGGSAQKVTGGAVGKALGRIDQTSAEQKLAADKNYQDYLKILQTVSSTPTSAYDSSYWSSHPEVPLQNRGGVINDVVITPEQAKLLGLTDNTNVGRMSQITPQMSSAIQNGTDSYGADFNHPTISSFLKEAADPTRETAATPDELAQLNALASLGGTEQNWLNPSATPYSANPNFDVSGFKNAAQGSYNQYLNDHYGKVIGSLMASGYTQEQATKMILSHSGLNDTLPEAVPLSNQLRIGSR